MFVALLLLGLALLVQARSSAWGEQTEALSAVDVSSLAVGDWAKSRELMGDSGEALRGKRALCMVPQRRTRTRRPCR